MFRAGSSHRASFLAAFSLAAVILATTSAQRPVFSKSPMVTFGGDYDGGQPLVAVPLQAYKRMAAGMGLGRDDDDDEGRRAAPVFRLFKRDIGDEEPFGVYRRRPMRLYKRLMVVDGAMPLFHKRMMYQPMWRQQLYKMSRNMGDRLEHRSVAKRDPCNGLICSKGFRPI